MPESSLYRELAEIPTFSSAVFLNSPDDATSKCEVRVTHRQANRSHMYAAAVVRVTYNVRDHARNTTRTFHKTHVVSPNHTFSSIPESAQTGVVQTVVSPSKRLVAYLRQEDDKGGAKTRAVEVWREGRLVARKVGCPATSPVCPSIDIRFHRMSPRRTQTSTLTVRPF